MRRRGRGRGARRVGHVRATLKISSSCSRDVPFPRALPSSPSTFRIILESMATTPRRWGLPLLGNSAAAAARVVLRGGKTSAWVGGRWGGRQGEGSRGELTGWLVRRVRR